ncbi:GNAT family N-acetyltransferase [Adhaeretor mobilis]|uniref:Ribosomal-protein-S5-alanine N-acetyltransferase n=1 Tax=Adhaeretor mobilis TaxID=1930276 RepID=A0A517MSD7_9BACT|nr:GNAT family N-acetyltransferase [Adhaeretor mobilis]QDS97791.1 ribosomal-protein-S5-alanine N-acetyltransferase [Adhaeretor mobilis]
MSDISLVRPNSNHQHAFLEAVQASKSLHSGWVRPPQTPAEFDSYVVKYSSTNHLAYLIIQGSSLVGVANFSEIVLGNFCSSYLGYYVFDPFSGTGSMKRGLIQAISRVFLKHGLNRVEANIQPENLRSIGLVRSLGFRREGFSERYLKIDGKWKDHERWAVHQKEWVYSGAA